MAEKVAAGHDLDLEEAVALSRVSLPLLGRIVQLWPATHGAGDTSVSNSLPVERVAALPDLPGRIGQCLADWESFCRDLIAIRGEVSSTGTPIFWYPIVEQPLDRDGTVGCSPAVREGGLEPTLPSQEIAFPCDGGFTGAEVLRAIALARLVLPAEVQVQAPLATLGLKLAQVALDFGASHLGYVAPNGQTSNDPLVADPSVLDELLESISRTAINVPVEPASAER